MMQLQKLDLADCAGITSAALHFVEQAAGLTHLDLSDTSQVADPKCS